MGLKKQNYENILNTLLLVTVVKLTSLLLHCTDTYHLTFQPETNSNTHAKDMTLNPHESDTNGFSSGKAGFDPSVGLLGFVVDTVHWKRLFRE